jgi:glyoxylase-like metal-dependent hydrolase (beta-lactamase superfamily II)
MYNIIDKTGIEDKAMKVTDNVYMLDCTSGSYSYVLLGDETVLVDTSFPGKGKAILAELAALGVKPQEIKHILLTHFDVDHIGNAAFLQQASGATVWASPIDIPYILGQKPRPGIKRYIGMMMKAKLPADLRAFPESNRLGEIEVIPTPGHTPGHVCLLYKGVLLAGDLVTTRGGQINPSPDMMTWNKKLVMESIKKVASLSFNWICPAHGLPVERGTLWDQFI